MKKLSRYPTLLWTACLVLVSSALYGCKDFLTDAASPQGTLNEETLANKAGVEGSLIAAYRSLDWNTGTGGNWGSAASNWVWASVPSDDAYKGSEPTDQPPINDVEAYFWTTGDADGYLNEKWRAVYEGVVRSNSTLRLLAAVVAANPSEISAADQASIEGEALFLRAHFHFEAWRMWGNIPYYLETDVDFRKPNNADPVAGSAAVVTAIIADLDAAIALLPTSPRNGHVGRVTQWTAKAYKGRVQVYSGAFAAAITTLTDVEQNGPYDLEQSFDRVWTGFAAFDNGPETIFAYQASANDGEPNGNNANYGERLNFPHGGSPFGCCGFHQPSQNLVNFYRVDGAGLPLALSAPTTWNTNNANFTSASAGAVDPRLDWTVGRDGVPYKDWGIHEPDWIRSVAYGGTYSAKKQAHEFASGAQSSVGWVNTQLNSVNIHIFRYADMLLLLAEALVERNQAGDLAAAHAIVNQIRARAGQTAQGCGFRAENDVDIPIPGCANQSAMAVAINSPSITWATYAVSPYAAAGTQAVMRDRVRAERRLELAMEGQRFFDLRRWGVAEATLDAYLAGVGGGNERARRSYLAAPGVDFQARHNLYPIPAIQIELSKVGGTPQLRQNNGW
ncbi:MAG: RagB/SusD family nutrient uptake outer membrane protein [Gemmatimonadaceae bacterium]